jgi:hypothetical protein
MSHKLQVTSAGNSGLGLPPTVMPAKAGNSGLGPRDSVFLPPSCPRRRVIRDSVLWIRSSPHRNACEGGSFGTRGSGFVLPPPSCPRRRASSRIIIAQRAIQIKLDTNIREHKVLPVTNKMYRLPAVFFYWIPAFAGMTTG